MFIFMQIFSKILRRALKRIISFNLSLTVETHVNFCRIGPELNHLDLKPKVEKQWNPIIWMTPSYTSDIDYVTRLYCSQNRSIRNNWRFLVSGLFTLIYLLVTAASSVLSSLSPVTYSSILFLMKSVSLSSLSPLFLKFLPKIQHFICNSRSTASAGHF